jgi:hypothetical protein
MPLRTILLRLMLWALVAAAVLGALAMLVFEGGDLAWRLLGTALVTAGAAAIALPLSLMTERPSVRLIGLLGLGAVLAEFLAALMLIWLDPVLRRSGETIFFSMLWIFLCVPPGLLCLWGAAFSHSRVAGWTGVVVAAVVLFLLLSWAWLGGGLFGGNDELLSSGGAVALFGFLAIVTLIGQGTDRRFWRWVGIAVGALGLAILLWAIWNHHYEDSGLMTLLISITAVIAHANLCEAVPLAGGQRWLGRAAIGAGIMAAVFLNFPNVAPAWLLHYAPDRHFLERCTAACGILAGCGTLALGVLVALNRRLKPPVVTYTAAASYTLICPACQSRLTLPTGEASCPRCRLIIRTAFEEPRCIQCNYSLFMLGSDRCPECGTPVSQSLTMAGGGPPEPGTPPLSGTPA